MSTSDTTNAILTANEQSATAGYTTGKAATSEGGFAFPRGSAYGEAVMQSLFGVRTPLKARSGDGSWVVTNTQGTAVTSQNVSAFGATTPAVVLVNSNAAGGAWIYPVRLKVTVVAVGTSSTNWVGRWLVDTTNRYTSGGSQFTPTSTNTQVTTTKTGALFYVGAITAPAATASRTIHIAQYRPVIPVAGDELMFEFSNSAPRSVGMAIDGTAACSKVEMVPSVGIPPGGSLLWYEFGASQAAARTFDNICLEYDER